MSKQVRWGVLGTSGFAKNHMVPAIHAAAGGCLAAIATRSPGKADDFVRIAPDLKVYDNYDALLQDESIDAIYVPLPNHLHFEWCRRVNAAGKHVLCEKPIALRADEIDELIRLRDSSGLLLAEAFMIVHHPQWKYVKALYQSGEIGSLKLVDGVFSYENRAADNIRNRPETGGGSLRDIGVYMVGSTRFVTDEEPDQVKLVSLELENEVDVYAHISAEFPTFHFSSVTSMRICPRQEINFHGDKGVIRLSAPFNAGVFGEARVELHRPELEYTVRRFPGVNQYVLQVESFNNSVTTGVDYPCALEFARGTQQMLDQVFDQI